MPWSNRDINLFHGTNTHALSLTSPALYQRLSGFSINLSQCRPLTDFGRGFYTTTNDHQARQWANDSARRLASRSPSIASHAIVLVFSLKRDWLAGLEALCFVRPTQDYFDLVADCRSGFPPHQRNPAPNRHYDVVYGPVSLGFQRLVIHDCDQISFHDQIVANGLPTPILHDVGTGAGGLFP
jgi:Protein of unknown function (DUF3990)